MGEFGKEGTGAYGLKTNLEKYLQEANAKYGTNIEIVGKPLKVGDTEIEVKTISTPGLTVKGEEGGLYTGAAFYNRFAHMAASAGAGKGKLSAGYLIGTPGITTLPKQLKKVDIDKRLETAKKYYDGSKDINQQNDR